MSFKSLKETITWSNSNYFSKNLGKIFIIGGSQVYEEAISNYNINNIYQTKVYGNFDCDKFFMSKDLFKDGKCNGLNLKSVSEFKEHNGIYFRFFVYSNFNSFNEPLSWHQRQDGEKQYLSILKKIIYMA